MSGTLELLDVAWLAGLTFAASRFRRALRDPAQAQERRLSELVRRNASSAFGREHSFDRVDSVAAFRTRVPVRDYEGHTPWIDRLVAGETRVLTCEPVIAFQPTSGSKGRPKLIPCTRALLGEFAASTGPWLHDLLARRPALRGTRSYWSISPATQDASRTPGGTSIGLADDTAYLDPVSRIFWRRKLAVGRAIAGLRDVAAWRDATALALLAADDLGLVSVWSPTFFTLLMEHIAGDFERLVQALPRRRADAIRRRVQGDQGISGRSLWPKLALVSCWADAGAAPFVPQLKRWLPGVELQPKGLLATEGVVSVPVLSRTGEESPPGSALAVGSHFLEFEDVESPGRTPLLAHQLAVGGRYAPLLTTGGGLWRYRLGDVVCCTGRLEQTPVVVFEGRAGATSDLCGEKLEARAVEVALEAASREVGVAPRFALLAPAAEAPLRYVLYLQLDADDAALSRFAETVEAELRGNFHYGYARDLGQLAAVEPRRVREGARKYLEALVAGGMKAGDVKPAALDGRSFWSEVFSGGAALDAAAVSRQPLAAATPTRCPPAEPGSPASRTPFRR